MAKDQRGQYIITDDLAHSLAKKYTKHSSREYAKVEPPKDLEKVLSILESQLEQKDKEINKLQNLLDQQQRLDLSTSQENRHLLGLKDPGSVTVPKQDKTRQKANQEPKEQPQEQAKPGLLARLFRRK